MSWKEEMEEAGKRNLKVYDHKGVEWFTEDDVEKIAQVLQNVKQEIA